jgi:hypothetical protein
MYTVAHTHLSKLCSLDLQPMALAKLTISRMTSLRTRARPSGVSSVSAETLSHSVNINTLSVKHVRYTVEHYYSESQ